MSTFDSRQSKLHDWIRGVLQSPDIILTPASSDASFRRYFRFLHNQQSYIAMDSSPEKENNALFISIAQRLDQTGLNVPHIYKKDLEQGFLLISDLGDQQYSQNLNNCNADTLYSDAITALLKMQTGICTEDLPRFNAEMIRFELDIFTEWFLQKHLNLSLSAAQQRVLTKTFDILIANIEQQPQIFMHRDYHSRNLMLCDLNNPGILDFQGAVKGPIAYDLVSLLRDCYIQWPEEKISQWIKQYLALLNKQGNNYSLKTFRHWFDLTGLQRHLKVMGLFMRLKYRDNKPHYLKDLPLTYDYIQTVCKQYPELEPFMQLLQELKVPQAVEALKQ